MTTDTQIIEIETLTALEVFGDGGVENILTIVQSKTDLGPVDMESEEDRDKVRSLAFKVAKTKTGLDAMGKEFIAAEKKKITAFDGRRAKLWDSLEALQKDVRRPLTEYEDAEKKRIADHQEYMEGMRQLLTFINEPSSDEVTERLQRAAHIIERDFEEFAQQAMTVYTATTERLSEKLAAVIKAEENERELAELRAKEAERVEQERIDALVNQKVEAVLAAAPAPLATSTTGSGTIPTTTPAIEHQRAINRAIVAQIQQIIDESDPQQAATEIVKAMAKGLIKNVKIIY